MAQQIKHNKNQHKSSPLPLKLAFQTNIFNYVQKRKLQHSVFAALNQNPSNSNQKHSSTSSNLIKFNTAFNFYQPPHNTKIDSEMLISARIKLLNAKPSQKGSILKRKGKAHKYSLSDWRVLYDQSDIIAQKHEMKQKSPDKMAATDRLFYPQKKQGDSVIQKSCSRQHINEREMNPSEKQRFFVSDQNFFHMYHRSVTPIPSDEAEKKRIVKYLSRNKERREMSNGLRLMNEGIFSELSKNDVAFVPYKFQSSGSSSKLYHKLQQNLNSEMVRNQRNIPYNDSETKGQNLSHLIECNQTHMERFRILKKPKQSSQRQKHDDNEKNKVQQNPEDGYPSPNKQIDKNHINLSELVYNPELNNQLKKEQARQLYLKMFKPKQNKIERAIRDSKKAKSQNKFANFEYSIKLPNSRKTSLNTTKYSKTKQAPKN